MTHWYISTACHHDRHKDCRQSCKFCLTACRCTCHDDSTCTVCGRPSGSYLHTMQDLAGKDWHQHQPKQPTP